MKEEGETEGVTYLDLGFSTGEDEFASTLRMFFFPGWPQCANPITTVFDAINLVQKWNSQVKNAPIVVIDKLGSSQAATYCALTSLSEQLKTEGFVDVYTCAKLYHMCRPGCWHGSNDLLFLYQAIVALSEIIEPTPVPMVLPEYEGLGPTVHDLANGNVHPVCYIRSRSPSSIEEIATPETESMYPNGSVPSTSNGCAAQDNYLREVSVCEETKLTIELLDDLLEEDEDDDDSEKLQAGEDIV